MKDIKTIDFTVSEDYENPTRSKPLATVEMKATVTHDAWKKYPESFDSLIGLLTVNCDSWVTQFDKPGMITYLTNELKTLIHCAYVDYHRQTNELSKNHSAVEGLLQDYGIDVFSQSDLITKLTVRVDVYMYFTLIRLEGSIIDGNTMLGSVLRLIPQMTSMYLQGPPVN